MESREKSVTLQLEKRMSKTKENYWKKMKKMNKSHRDLWDDIKISQVTEIEIVETKEILKIFTKNF